MLKKALLIYNTESGSDQMASLLPLLIQEYQEKEILLVPYCLNITPLFKLKQLLMKEEYAMILISGGDGTVRSTLSFLLNNHFHIPVGIIPSGTCNDLANSLEIPKEIYEAARIPLKNNIEHIDIGHINGKDYFFSSLAGGYILQVAYNTPTQAKKNLKQFAYYLRAAFDLGNLKPYTLKFSVDNHYHEMDTLMFAFSTGSQVAGFKNIVHTASLHDGKLDFFVIKKCSILDLTTILFSIVTGKFTENEYVSYFQGKHFTLDGPSDLALTYDGDIGGHLPLTVDTLEQTMEFFVP